MGCSYGSAKNVARSRLGLYREDVKRVLRVRKIAAFSRLINVGSAL